MGIKILNKKAFIAGFKVGRFSMENAPLSVLADAETLTELLPYDKQGNILDFAFKKTFKNEAFIKQAVLTYGGNFNKLPPNLRNREDLALLAFEKTKGNILNLGNKLNTYEFAEKLIKLDPFALRSFRGEVFRNKELNLLAVQREGLVYRNLCPENMQDEDIIVASLTNNGFVYHFLDDKNKANIEYARIAMKTARDYTELVYRDMPNDVRSDKDISLQACDFDLRCLKYTPFETVLDDEFKLGLNEIITKKIEELQQNNASEVEIERYESEAVTLVKQNYQRAIEEKEAYEIKQAEELENFNELFIQ